MTDTETPDETPDEERMERLFALLEELDRGGATTVTSTRVPTALHEALRVAVELGMDGSSNDATNQALRDRVDAFAQHLALEEHFRRYPWARPTLAQLALAAAELDGDPLADDPALLDQAAAEVAERWPDATGDDVLIYATALDRHRKPHRRKTPAAR